MPLIEILVGVVLDSEAFPPEIENIKSFASKVPLPLLVLNTASDIVTANVLLSGERYTEEINGDILSFKNLVPDD